MPAAVRDAVDVIVGLRDFFGHAPKPAAARAGAPPPPPPPGGAIQRIRRLEGNETLVSALVEPRCGDGTVPAQPGDCSPALVSLTLTVAPVGGDAAMYRFSWADAACVFSAIQNTTLCTLAASVPAYSRVNLATFATYADGSRSAM